MSRRALVELNGNCKDVKLEVIYPKSWEDESLTKVLDENNLANLMIIDASAKDVSISQKCDGDKLRVSIITDISKNIRIEVEDQTEKVREQKVS